MRPSLFSGFFPSPERCQVVPMESRVAHHQRRRLTSVIPWPSSDALLELDECAGRRMEGMTRNTCLSIRYLPLLSMSAANGSAKRSRSGTISSCDSLASASASGSTNSSWQRRRTVGKSAFSSDCSSCTSSTVGSGSELSVMGCVVAASCALAAGCVVAARFYYLGGSATCESVRRGAPRGLRRPDVYLPSDFERESI
jgi:hypothetical protein